jgi:hypothetical protein
VITLLGSDAGPDGLPLAYLTSMESQSRLRCSAARLARMSQSRLRGRMTGDGHLLSTRVRCRDPGGASGSTPARPSTKAVHRPNLD